MKKNIILFFLSFIGTIVPDLTLIFLRKGLDVYISITTQNKILLAGLIAEIFTLIWYSAAFNDGERKWFTHVFALISFIGLLYNIFTFMLMSATNQAMNSFM